MIDIVIVLLAAQASVPAAPASGDVPAKHEAAWTACRNEKGAVSYQDELKGCEALIAADDVDNGIRAVAHVNRGMLMAQASFLETAKDELDRAIALNPALGPAYYNRAMVLEAKGDRASAIADYGAAIERNPDMVEAYINRGIARARSGQQDLALADFNQAIALEPGSADIYGNRAVLLREMGRSKDADADEARAKELAK